MTDATSDLVAQLCTRVGMLMEDCASDAMLIAGMKQPEQSLVIGRLKAAAAEIDALVRAAEFLVS